jgi:adenylate cyclase
MQAEVITMQDLFVFEQVGTDEQGRILGTHRETGLISKRLQRLPSLESDRRRITVLIADIRGFTPFSETLEPKEVEQFLSQHHQKMAEAISRNHGVVDKFMGDAVMAVFGAPRPDSDHERHAVEAAIEMQKEMRELHQQWETEGRPAIRMGVGINSGDAFVGNVGSENRVEYTILGDMVNFASRLEAATKEVDADILVGESTYGAVRDQFRFREMPPIQVKGKAGPVVTYAIEEI